MKTIILAGGYATRLWPLTRFRAKPLLPLGKKRIIDLIMEKLKGVEGDVIVCTNELFAYDFREWKEKNGYDVEIFVEKTKREEEKLGAIRALHQLIKQKGKDDYLIIAGDNVFSFKVKDFLSFARDKGIALVAYKLGDLKKASRYGVIEVDKNLKVKRFVEKPKRPRSDLIMVCCFFLKESMLHALDEFVKRGKKLDSPGCFFEWAHRKYDVYAYPFSGYWFDIGHPDSYLEAFLFLTRRKYIEESVELWNCEIKGKTVILGNARIKDAYLKDCFIGTNSKILNSEVEKSMIFDNTFIKNTKMEKCIIDSYSYIENVSLKGSVIGGYSKLYQYPI